MASQLEGANSLAQPVAEQANMPPPDFSAKITQSSMQNNLRLQALNNLASGKVAGDVSGTASPLISARYVPPTSGSNQSSPTRLPNSSRNSLDNEEPGAYVPSLTRQNSGASLDTHVPKERVRERSRSPSKYSAGSRSFAERADSDAPSGLDFLLQACDMLEPEENVTSKPRPVGRPSRKNGGQRPRRFSDDGEYTPGDSSEDEEYRPSRANRAARRAASAAAPRPAAAPAPAPPPANKWERGMVQGPCTNPDCEHPEDSPQWRKGPPQHPVLCNACGTRWLRNGTLKPLVPRRGIRYNKSRTRQTSRPASRNAAPAPAPAMYDTYEEDEMLSSLPESSQEGSGDARRGTNAGPSSVPSAPMLSVEAVARPPQTEAQAPAGPSRSLSQEHDAHLQQQANFLALAMQNAMQAAPFLQPMLQNGSLEQQIAAVSAAAAAAAAAQQALVSIQPPQLATLPQFSLALQGVPAQSMKASPFAASARPVFNLTANAASVAQVAPLFKPVAPASQQDEGNNNMQLD